MRTTFLAVTLGLVVLAVIGCGGNATSTTSTSPASPPDERYLLSEEPAGAQSVIEARKAVKDGDEVTITGRIGGTKEPWVLGRATFSIVDPSLIPCNERAGDSCPTPWDYCCDTDRLVESMATIKIVDDQGQTVPKDAKALLGLKELQRVTIRGTAKRDDAGNLTVLATKVHIKQ